MKSAFHQRHGLRQVERSRTLTVATRTTISAVAALALLLAMLRRRRSERFFRQTNDLTTHVGEKQRFKANELVAILLEDGGGEGLASHHEDGLTVFLQFVDQRNKVAIAADDGKRIDMRVRERHFQGIQREVDVRAILIAPGRGNALNHLDGVFRHLARGAVLAAPVRVGELGDQIAALLQSVQCERDVEFAPQRGLQSDLDVVVIDKHRDVQFILHLNS